MPCLPGSSLPYGAPLVFIDFLSRPRRRPRDASSRLRGGSARQMRLSPCLLYWTSCNLQGLSATVAFSGRKLKTVASSGYLRRCPPRIWRRLSNRLARTPYGEPDPGCHLELPVGGQCSRGAQGVTALWHGVRDATPNIQLTSCLGRDCCLPLFFLALG